MFDIYRVRYGGDPEIQDLLYSNFVTVTRALAYSGRVVDLDVAELRRELKERRVSFIPDKDSDEDIIIEKLPVKGSKDLEEAIMK